MIDEYVFEEKCADEFEAFRKYYEAILENKYIVQLINDCESMGDPCEIYADPYIYPENERADNVKALRKPSDSIIFAHRSIRMRSAPKIGRHLVAENHFRKGTVIVSEPPVIIQVESACVHAGVGGRAIIRCHQCSSPIKAFLTCENCDFVVFCNKQCKQLASDYHYYECYGLQRHYWTLNPDDREDHSYLAMRMMMYGAKTLFNTKPESETAYGSKTNNYPFIWQLESCFNRLTTAQLDRYLKLTTRTLVYLISKTEFLDYLATNLNKKLYDTYLYVGGIMLKHFCQAAVNAIIPTYSMKMVELAINLIGSSNKIISPTVSLINHSCVPNAVVIPYPNGIVVKTTQDIHKHEQITICYQEIDPYMSVFERKSICDETYGFDCNCTSCKNDILTAEALYKCPECEGKSYKLIKDEEEYGYCLDCNTAFPFENIAKLLKQSVITRRLFDTTKDQKMLLRMISIDEEIYHKHAHCLYRAYKLVSTVSISYSETKDGVYNAIKYGLKSHRVMEQRASPFNLQVITKKYDLFTKVLQSEKKLVISEMTPDCIIIFRQWEEDLMQLKDQLKFYIPNYSLQFFAILLSKVKQLLHNGQIIAIDGAGFGHF